MRTVETPFEYRFRAGDGQTDWFTVGVADRPEIDELQLTVTPPAYTRQETKKFDKLPPRVAAMEQSEFELALTPTIPVQARAAAGEDKNVPLTADADGWFRWNTTLKEGFTLAPILTEPRAHQSARAEMPIHRLQGQAAGGESGDAGRQAGRAAGRHDSNCFHRQR